MKNPVQRRSKYSNFFQRAGKKFQFYPKVEVVPVSPPSSRSLIRYGDPSFITTSNHILSSNPHMSTYLLLLEQIKQGSDKPLIETLQKTGVERGSLSEEAFNEFKRKLEQFFEKNDLKKTKWEALPTENGLALWVIDDKELLTYRTETSIDLPLETCAKYAVDNKFKLKMEPKTFKLDIVKEYSDTSAVIHMGIKMPWPLANREILLYRHAFYLNENEFILISYDSHDEKYEPIPESVRIQCELTGSIFTRVGPNQTKYISFSSSNPNIKNLPIWMMKSKIKEIAQDILTFKKAIEKEEKGRVQVISNGTSLEKNLSSSQNYQTKNF